MTILFVLILNNISMMVPSSSRHVFAAAETVVVEGTCAADDVTCTGSTPPTNPEMEATRTTTSCTDDDVDCDYWANEMNECQDNPECKFLRHGGVLRKVGVTTSYFISEFIALTKNGMGMFVVVIILDFLTQI